MGENGGKVVVENGRVQTKWYSEMGENGVGVVKNGEDGGWADVGVGKTAHPQYPCTHSL